MWRWLFYAVVIIAIVILWRDVRRRREAANFVPSERLNAHQAHLKALFASFIEVAEKNGLDYWISDGTLLGAVRERDIIKWDDDVDLQIPEATLDQLKRLQPGLKRQGIELALDDDIWRFRYVDHSAYIDLFVMKREGDRWVYADGKLTERWPAGYFLKSEVYPLRKYKFGHLIVDGPRDHEGYLSRMYGEWRVPDKWRMNHGYSL